MFMNPYKNFCAVRMSNVSACPGYNPVRHAAVALSDTVHFCVDYTTYLHNCPDEFVPKLNHEHDSCTWVHPDQHNLVLHPGLHIAFRKWRCMKWQPESCLQPYAFVVPVSPQYTKRFVLDRYVQN